MSERTARWSIGRLAVASGITLAMAFAAVSCSDGESSQESGQESSATTGEADSAGGGATDVSAARGEELARTEGCAGCHGSDFDGGAGPSWIGLAGSEVTLADGRTLVADDAYLVRAIADPSADVADGYNLRMPANGLSAGAIDDIVAYINTLGEG